ncbi:AAA family ATPase [Candidatus Poribacteria bacterium]|nr:AAA family ATPase [Candidatus Poribacteria bacterium]
MKLCKLKLKNLNSFRDEVELDFDEPPLDEASLVAITGPTGAGKTTLLDAICVALYGKTPRLSGTGSQNPNYLISHGEKEGFAEVHFVANGTRYIAAWSGKLKASPKGSLLNADSDKLISDRLSARGKSLGSSENTVSEEVTAILGLDFDAFKRSVMLAQGEFAAFLKAKDEERRTILEAAANVDIYDELKRTLNDKVTTVETEYQSVLQKLEAVPEASLEQLTEAETELARLQAEAEKLGGKNQQIQTEKEHETKRKEDYEKLQSSEENQKELINQQPMIDKLKSELEDAERANQLRAEKQVYDTAKSNHEKAADDLQKAEIEFTDTQKQVETNQANFDKKDETYQTALSERERKIDIFNTAKLEVSQAENQFEQANNRITDKKKIDDQIETTLNKLTEKETRQTELQEQIAEAQTFLDENPLPSDRQSRLNRTSVLLSELNSKCQLQKEKEKDQSEYELQIGKLKEKLKELTENRKELLLKEKTVKNSLKQAEAEFKELQENGTLEDWQSRRDNARKAQPIAQQYENLVDQLGDKRDDLAESKEKIIGLDESLDSLNKKLEVQSQLCKRADAEVEKLEAEKELALLTEPVNALRQQLEEGKPCRVCGATDHPYADKVESEKLLESILKALDDAETEAKKAQKQKQKLERDQARLQQDKSHTVEQVDECVAEIENLNTETEDLCAKWKELYESADISFEWVDERFDEADTAIENLNTTQETYNEVSSKLNEVSHKLETCQNNLNRENELLNDTKQELESITDEIEVLKLDISDTEKDFWTSMPEVFHGVTPDKAVKQFDDKIKVVDLREQELTTKNSRLNVLNTEIQNDQRELQDLQERQKELEAEIERYQNEGETFIDAVRDKTGGLELEDDINAAIDELNGELQAKKAERDEAKQQLEKSRTLLTQKETTQKFCEEQLKENCEKFETAGDAYLDKLNKAGFESPEAHDVAFRDEAQIQALTEKTDAHENEKQQLDVEIVALRTQFVEVPFSPEVLKLIISQAEEIAAEIQSTQEKIGRQNEKIDNLKDDLQKREKLDSEVHAAKQEWERWKKLQEIIPRNELRDFALDIMFQQVSRIANVQLAYLTSERYQLDVETIGKLTVIDRWNANEKRPVETLSGGESFLTSLALALALSELSQGRAQLNSLFLDEGFGTLDTETLDIAISALEGLRMQGRSIYLISHIQELTRRLPVKINVKKRGNGSSYIEIRD